MQVHARAALSPIGRRRVVDRVRGQGWSVTAAAEAAGVTERTVYRWLARFRVHGASGLVDRRPVPRRVPARTPADRVTAICELRQLRLTAAEISERLAMPLSTVSIVLEAGGARQALAARAPRAGQPLRTPPAGRARPHRRQEARAHPGRAGQAGHRAPRALGTHPDRRRGCCTQADRVGVRARRRR